MQHRGPKVAFYSFYQIMLLCFRGCVKNVGSSTTNEKGSLFYPTFKPQIRALAIRA